MGVFFWRCFGALMALGVSTLWLPACSPQVALPHVSLEQARAELEAGKVVMIDIREPQEHATGVAQGVVLLPTSQVAQRVAEIPQQADQPVLLICHTQSRSRAVTQALQEQGFTNIRYVHGGMSGWAKRGWPMVKPENMPTPPKP